MESIGDSRFGRSVIQAAGWRRGPAGMAKPYSTDLRERVAGAVLSGGSCREVASTFGVSVASAVKWAQRLRASGSAAAKPMGGPRPCLLAGEEAWLLARLEACPHLTVRALADELRGRCFDVSHNGVWHQLRRAGFSFKKRCSPPNRTGPGSPGGARSGRSVRGGLIQPGSSSSTKPRPRPT